MGRQWNLASESRGSKSNNEGYSLSLWSGERGESLSPLEASGLCRRKKNRSVRGVISRNSSCNFKVNPWRC